MSSAYNQLKITSNPKGSQNTCSYETKPTGTTNSEQAPNKIDEPCRKHEIWLLEVQSKKYDSCFFLFYKVIPLEGTKMHNPCA